MNIEKRHAGRRIRKQRRRNRELSAAFMRMGLTADMAALRVAFLSRSIAIFAADIADPERPTIKELNSGTQLTGVGWDALIAPRAKNAALVAEGNRVHADIPNGTVES